MKIKITAALFLIVCCFGGCATRSDMDALYQRIVLLENQNRELRNRNEAAASEIDKLNKNLNVYDSTLQEKDTRLRTDQAGLHATFERFREEIQTLNGKIEETDYLLKKTVNRLDSSERNSEARLAKLEQYLNFEKPVYTHSGTPPKGQASDPVVRKPSDMPMVPSETPVRRPTETEIITRPSDPVIISESSRDSIGSQADTLFSEVELYNLAKQALDEGNLPNAREGFQEFLSKYPNSKNADNAQFWIGETYYREKWYEKAIDEYSKVTEKYPNGNKVRAALLKMGYSFDALGDKRSARTILEELVAQYPDSSEAEIANKKLSSGF